MRIVPEHSENATAAGVERVTSASLEIGHSATGVVTVGTHALGTEGISEVSLWLRTVLGPVLRAGVGVQLAVSAGTSVERVLIGGCRVHVLDDIDLMGDFG